MDVLCKWHVIVKYMLGHDANERFFPIMTCAFWLNIVLQSFVYITYINPQNISLESEEPKILIVAFFFCTIVLLSFAVKNGNRYQKAELWFSHLSVDVKISVKVIVALTMFTSFLALMSWAIFLM